MSVTTIDVLTDANFLPVAEARRQLEREFRPLIPTPEFKTNGPASYFRFADSEQKD